MPEKHEAWVDTPKSILEQENTSALHKKPNTSLMNLVIKEMQVLFAANKAEKQLVKKNKEIVENLIKNLGKGGEVLLTPFRDRRSSIEKIEEENDILLEAERQLREDEEMQRKRDLALSVEKGKNNMNSLERRRKKTFNKKERFDRVPAGCSIDVKQLKEHYSPLLRHLLEDTNKLGDATKL